MLRRVQDAVLGFNWKETTLKFGKNEIRLQKVGSEYWVEIERLGEKKAYRVDYVFGGNWKLLFLTTFPNGEIHILPISWLVEEKNGK